MSTHSKQSGATLIVSLVMLVVLTLLVVTAIRSGSTNLRIAGNTQVKVEANAAAQQAIEQVINTDFTTTPVSQTVTVDMGATTYSVAVSTPVCNNTVPIYSDDASLDHSDENDKLCFEENPPPPILDANGKPIPVETKCKRQQWEVQADITDPNSGVHVTQHQGVTKRTYLPTSC